jgi:hypothetical protein
LSSHTIQTWCLLFLKGLLMVLRAHDADDQGFAVASVWRALEALWARSQASLTSLIIRAIDSRDGVFIGETHLPATHSSDQNNGYANPCQWDQSNG